MGRVSSAELNRRVGEGVMVTLFAPTIGVRRDTSGVSGPTNGGGVGDKIPIRAETRDCPINAPTSVTAITKIIPIKISVFLDLGAVRFLCEWLIWDKVRNRRGYKLIWVQRRYNFLIKYLISSTHDLKMRSLMCIIVGDNLIRNGSSRNQCAHQRQETTKGHHQPEGANKGFVNGRFDLRL